VFESNAGRVVAGCISLKNGIGKNSSLFCEAVSDGEIRFETFTDARLTRADRKKLGDDVVDLVTGLDDVKRDAISKSKSKSTQSTLCEHQEIDW
jgi:hypothetical protein